MPPTATPEESRSLLQRIYESAISYIEWPSFEDLLDDSGGDGSTSPGTGIGGVSDDPSLLGRYSLPYLQRYVKESGIEMALKAKGFDTIRLSVDVSDHFVHKFYIWDASISCITARDTDRALLVELVIRRVRDVLMFKSISRLIYPVTTDPLRTTDTPDVTKEGAECVQQLAKMEHLDFIIIEWIRMQDPRPIEGVLPLPVLLPGQEHPSLGIGRVFFQALLTLAKKAGRDAFINIPLYFHSALFYHKNKHCFMNPVVEGIFRKLLMDIRVDLEARGLHWVSLAVLKGGLFARVNGTWRRVRWKGEEMMESISDRMKSYLDSSLYKATVKRYAQSITQPVFELRPTTEMASEEEWKHAIAVFEVETSSASFAQQK